MDTVHLYFDRELNAYCLQLKGDVDTSYTLGIMADWDDQRRPQRAWLFKRIAHEAGEWEEITTPEEAAGRIKDIAEHEGDAIARHIELHQTWWRQGTKSELKMFADAARRFLAFAELGLDLPVLHGGQFVHGRPMMCAEDEAELERLRQAEFSRRDGDDADVEQGPPVPAALADGPEAAVHTGFHPPGFDPAGCEACRRVIEGEG
jgi:hypothetical protein